MIQRIQTTYLLLVFLLMGIFSWFVSFGEDNSGHSIWLTTHTYLMVMFIFAALLALFSIFRFKNRKSQFMLNRLNIIIQFILLGIFVSYSIIRNEVGFAFEKSIGVLFPVITIVLLVLANRAIKKDEALVKSIDRLR